MDRKRRLMENNNGWPLRSQLFDGAPFRLPLTHTAVPASAASGTTATFTRATTKTWQNNDGYLVTGLAGEIGFPGARRVDNLIRLGAAQSSTLAVAANVTMTLPAGAYQFSMGAGTGTATFSGTGGATGTLAASASARTFVAKTISAGTLIVTASVATLVDIQVVSMVAETDQTTEREYVSIGVESAPYYHGSFVDGVKCFPTDISGNPIPSTTLLGYLAEGARTNLCLQSNAFTTTWATFGTPAATQNVVGPDGATSAWTLTDNDAGAYEGVFQTDITLTAATYTLSFFVKKTVGAQSSYPVILTYLKVGTTSLAGVTVDTSNGVATAWTAYTGFTGVNGSATCVSYNATYWRVALTFTGTAAAWRVDIGPAGTTNPTQSTGAVDATAQGSAVFYGAQLELGSFASSCIATTTIAVARNADVLTYSSSGNIDVTKGWAYAEVTYPNGAGLQKGVINTSNGAPLYISSTNKVSLYDGTSERFGTSFSVSANTQKIASTWGGAASSTANAGVVTATSGFDGDLSLVGSLEIGSNTGGSNSAFGIIRGIRIGQRLLSTSEEGAITA